MSFDEIKWLQQSQFEAMSSEQKDKAKMDIIAKLDLTSQKVMRVSYDLKQQLQNAKDQLLYDNRFWYNAKEAIALVNKAEEKMQQANVKHNNAELAANTTTSEQLSELANKEKKPPQTAWLSNFVDYARWVTTKTEDAINKATWDNK